MNDRAQRQIKTPLDRPFWKLCIGCFFLSAGPLVVLSVAMQWTTGFWRPQITHLGLLAIWIGVLFLQTGKSYFSVISSLILLLSLIGFADNLIFDIGQPSNRDPKFAVHGLFSLAWMIAFALQAELVRTGRVSLHKRIGIAGFLAAAGFAISTFYLFYVLWKPWGEMLDRAQFNRILLPSFVILIVLAWIYRKRPEYHKRMLLVGTLYLQLPIIARATSGSVHATIVVWAGLYASLFIYDWIVAKKIHAVTYLGSFWFCIVWAVVLLT